MCICNVPVCVCVQQVISSCRASLFQSEFSCCSNTRDVFNYLANFLVRLVILTYHMPIIISILCILGMIPIWFCSKLVNTPCFKGTSPTSVPKILAFKGQDYFRKPELTVEQWPLGPQTDLEKVTYMKLYIRSPTKPSHLAAVSEIFLIWVDMQHVWTPAWSMHDLATPHITHSGWNRNSCRGTDAHMNVDFSLHIDCLIFGEVPSHVICKKSVFDIWLKPKRPASSVWTLKSNQQGEWKIYWFAATMKPRVKRHSW